jgi:hypothetical protein
MFFGDSLAAVELLYAAPNFRIDGASVLQEPAVLFFLRIEKAEQRLLRTGGAGGLHLPLDSGFQIRVLDFDAHGTPFLVLFSPVLRIARLGTKGSASYGCEGREERG